MKCGQADLYTVRGLKLRDENDVRTRRDAARRVSTPYRSTLYIVCNAQNRTARSRVIKRDCRSLHKTMPCKV
jgi:hypothetical protein